RCRSHSVSRVRAGLATVTIEGGEAAADVLTGAVAASTVEPEAGTARTEREGRAGSCLNCGATLTGHYCASCGQSAHIHRSLRSLGHDVLHSVLHFARKFWRTIPWRALSCGTAHAPVHPGRAREVHLADGALSLHRVRGLGLRARRGLERSAAFGGRVRRIDRGRHRDAARPPRQTGDRPRG